MDKICTPEEIEKKRKLALQKRQQAQLRVRSTLTCSPVNNQQLKANKNVARPNKSNNRFNPIEPKNFCNSTQFHSVTGNCYMVSSDRFTLETSLFVPAIIDTFKTISSRIYDPKSRTWNFHLNDYDSLLQTLSKSNQYTIHVSRIPEAVLRIFKKNLKSDNQILDQDLSRIDTTLTDALMPFQQEGVCYGISKHGRCLIADDMGLGKTIQALGIAHYFKDSWPLLIVAPSSVKYHWSAAIYQYLPSVPTHYVHHFANAKDCIEDEKITITSYDLLVRAVATFERHIYGFVILDESHCVKSTKTNRFQAAQRICAQARHTLLLSGTPALSKPIELYSQINLIIPRFMSYEDYGMRYCAGKMSQFGWEFSGSSNMQELQALLKTTCVIRRLKADVLHELTSKKREVIILDPALIKSGTKQMGEMAKLLQRNISGTERHNAIVQYYNESSYARLKAVRNYVSDLFKSKKKCLLYAHHQVVMDAICDLADSMNIGYIRIDGKTSSEQRKLQVDRFQEEDHCLAAILSITAANSGITLTAAHLVVFTELFWNPGILCQAEDRAHRIGQSNSVTIYYLVAKDTADDYMWPLIAKKLNVLNDVGLKQDLSISNVCVTVQSKSKRDLTSYLNTSSSSSQSHDMECSPADSEEQDAAPEAASSTSSDVKALLEADEEYFGSCDWDDII
ncbi:PREDICTED: SWI/SNF-related matrix-associated actin-dependent regulator of chromatin subfamily A-like protein 1 isoform X2 [Wasmannia auropunctata]|uniref:SWI/SNF-related matrix-associated actin-dependent regulator of chromatin subfamily A-like protein 1 isoform X2 n=1 Tax=Wasmannia auropunctata TaxID=64793 RepID=UPI0005EF36BB|nr:PREDICTED: SWI/SNF-related matrix-associated actin-dependent regulator of chromatin subfamily A-like protein 1 isoform X2 [Wasmannia auropunctata]